MYFGTVYRELELPLTSPLDPLARRMLARWVMIGGFNDGETGRLHGPLPERSPVFAIAGHPTYSGAGSANAVARVLSTCCYARGSVTGFSPTAHAATAAALELRQSITLRRFDVAGATVTITRNR